MESGGFEDAAPADELMAGNNMVANLPLLFAAGYPTTLAKITEAQLERFIPFMVQCSLGCIQLNMDFEYSEPEWWPEDVPFAIPLRRPASIAAEDWHEKLREIVIICYSFHKVVYLLRFCNDLAQHQPQYLRFINNQNTTTSLFDRLSNKLLVTFRNENMLYDHKPKPSVKKTLMPRQNSNAHPIDGGDHNEDSDHHNMVEPALFDIYLCDYCEAELYSLQAYRDHEKACELDDDVIFCGELPEPPKPLPKISEKLLQQANFLKFFGLVNDSVPITLAATTSPDIGKSPGKPPPSSAKMRRMPRRGRAILGLAKCPTIAISSPAGQRLVQTSKSLVSGEYLSERLERTERFCHTPLLGQHGGGRKTSSSLAYLQHNTTTTNQAAGSAVTTTFRRPADYSTHVYTFPRRQFSQLHAKESSRQLNAFLMRLCKPLIVPLDNLSVAEQEELRRKSRRPIASGRKLTNFQLKQMELRRLRERAIAAADVTATTIIDLCSSGDEEDAADDHRRLDGRVDEVDCVDDDDDVADDYMANERLDAALPDREAVSVTVYRRSNIDIVDPMALVSVVDSTDRQAENQRQQLHRYSQHSNDIQQQLQQSSNSTPYSLSSLATTSSSSASSFESVVPLTVQRKSIADSLTEAVQSSMLQRRHRHSDAMVHRVRHRRDRRRASPLLPHRYDVLNSGGEATGNNGNATDTDDVLIISRMTHTSMTLDSHKQLYNYHQNQDENRYGTSATTGQTQPLNAGPAVVQHRHRQQQQQHHQHHHHHPHHNQQPLPTTLSLNNGGGAVVTAASMIGGPDGGNSAICSATTIELPALPQSVTLTLLQPQHTSIDLT